jgi:CRP-like cAMP-binding protein
MTEWTKLSVARSPTGNRLLAALPRPDFLRVVPHLTSVTLSRGEALHEYGERSTHAYFPTDGVVSVTVDVSVGPPMEIAIIGSEGLVGISILLEDHDRPMLTRRSVVQMMGHAYRIRADVLRTEFARGGELQRSLLRFTQALLMQIAQTAVCNRRHDLEAQLCRWLLQRADRLPGADIPATAQELAALLGVQRDQATVAVVQLEQAGLIHHAGSAVAILDLHGLAKRACECRDRIRKEYARLLGDEASTRDDTGG